MTDETKPATEPRFPPPRCSFCGKNDLQVRVLFAAPTDAFICNECVANISSELFRMATVMRVCDAPAPKAEPPK